jgi:hypothetical protein
MRKKFAKPSEVLPDRIGAGKDSGEFLTVWMLQQETLQGACAHTPRTVWGVAINTSIEPIQ